MYRDATLARDEHHMISGRASREELQRWQALERAAVTAIPDAKAREDSRLLIAAAIRSQEQLRQIDEKLDWAVAEARRAANAKMWFDVFGQGLEFAAQLKGVAQNLGPNGIPSPLQVSTTAELEKFLTSKADAAKADLVRLEQRRTVIWYDHQGNVKAATDQLRTFDIPIEMLPPH